MKRLALGLALLSLTACSGVHHTVRSEFPQPATIAVLPLSGGADVGAREATRALLNSRLAARGYRTAELPWVDRVLSERGWLRDPATFPSTKLPIDDVLAALGVDAIVVGDDFDESSFNVLVLRRHSFGGALALQTKRGPYWSANHSAGAYGGFLLTSGQVFSEIRAQGDHGTPMMTLALIDELVDDVVETVPARKNVVDPGAEPKIAEISTRRETAPDGGTRLVVESTAQPGCSVWLDVLPTSRGIPMVALPNEPGRYRGTHDVPANDAVVSIVIRARTPFGRETRREVTP